jgi:ribonuclease HI
MSNKVNIYTDGSAIGNPGPGGYGVIMEWVNKKYLKEFSDGYQMTTNNRMELLAVIVALESLKIEPMDVMVFSDSKYVIESVEKKWVFNWQKKQFKGKKNHDLWQRYLLIDCKHRVRFQWVKGHNKHPQNERCDSLAVNAAKNKNKKIDHFYEKSIRGISKS